MAGLVTVHKTMEEEVPKVITFLENRCLHPVVLDDAEKMAFRRRGNQVRIGVPEAERDTAVRVLDELQRQEQFLALPTVRRADAVFLLIMIAMVFLVIVLVLDPEGKCFAWILISLGVLGTACMVRQMLKEEPDRSPPEESDRE